MTFRQWFRVLTTPSCWIQLGPYSTAWDTKLKRALAEHKFREAFYLDDEPAFAKHATKPDPYNIHLGPYRLWISNHPYGSFRKGTYGPRARRITTLEAYDKMQEDLL